MNTKYDIQVLELTDIIKKIQEEEFIMPKYQRGIRWTKDTSKKLLESINSGDPLGTLLFSRENINGVQKLSIIDGQQRLTTIKSFMEEPLQYFDESYFDEELIRKALEISIPNISEMQELSKNKQLEDVIVKLKENFIKLYEDLKDYEIEKKWNKILVKWANICSGTNIDINNEEVSDIISDILTDLKSKFELDDIKIPVIIYEGTTEQKANLFEKINTGSKPLTKYEILNAEWNALKIDFSDEIVRDIIDAYSSVDREFALDESISIEENTTLFDYCFALNHKIINSSKMFGGKDSNVGFEILSMIMSGFPNKIEELRKLYTYVEGEKLPKLLNDLYDKITSSVTEFDKQMSFLTSNNKNFDLFEKTYQTYHIFMAFFLKKYQIEYTEYLSDGSKRNGIYFINNLNVNKEDISVNRIEAKIITFNDKRKYDNKIILLRMLHSITNGYYENYRQVSDMERIVREESIRNLYYSKVEQTEFENRLDEWIQNQLVDSKFFKKTINKDVKKFTYLFHLLKMESDSKYKEYILKDGEDLEFEYDHIVPKSVLDSSVPTSSALNVRYIDKRSNRKKGARSSKSQETLDLTTNFEFLELIGIDKDYVNKIKEVVDEMHGKDRLETFKLMLASRGNSISKLIKEMYLK